MMSRLHASESDERTISVCSDADFCQDHTTQNHTVGSRCTSLVDRNAEKKFDSSFMRPLSLLTRKMPQKRNAQMVRESLPFDLYEEHDGCCVRDPENHVRFAAGSDGNSEEPTAPVRLTFRVHTLMADWQSCGVGRRNHRHRPLHRTEGDDWFGWRTACGRTQVSVRCHRQHRVL